MSELQKQLTEDKKTALKKQDKERLATIRMLESEITTIITRDSNKKKPDDYLIINTIRKMIKTGQSAIVKFKQAGRLELAEKEAQQIDILQAYLPTALPEAEINTMIDEAIIIANATSTKEMGKVMSILKIKLQGRADMGTISKRIKERLA